MWIMFFSLLLDAAMYNNSGALPESSVTPTINGMCVTFCSKNDVAGTLQKPLP